MSKTGPAAEKIAQTSNQAKNVVSKVGDFVDPSETITANQETILKGLGHLGTAATVLTTVGGVLDIVSNVRDNREAKNMQKEQEKNLKKKQKNQIKGQRKYRRKKNNPLYTKGMVQQMYDQSTGHTRYGASKLPGL